MAHLFTGQVAAVVALGTEVVAVMEDKVAVVAALEVLQVQELLGLTLEAMDKIADHKIQIL
jgi:hypothetical protein